MNTFAPYYNRYNNFSGKSDFLPLAAIAAGVSSGGSILSSIGGIFTGRSQEKVNKQTALANQYNTEGFTPAYKDNVKAFFEGMMLYKVIYQTMVKFHDDIVNGVKTPTAAELEKYEKQIKAITDVCPPLTPEMTGLSFKFPPQIPGSSALSSTNSVTDSLSAASSTAVPGSIKETLSKNKNTILIVVIVLLVLTIAGFFIVKAIRK